MPSMYNVITDDYHILKNDLLGDNAVYTTLLILPNLNAVLIMSMAIFNGFFFIFH